MEWVPAVFIVFKATVLGIGMYLAIKWHYDQGKKKTGAKGQREVLRAWAITAAVFLLLLAALLFLTFRLGSTLGLDLSMP